MRALLLATPITPSSPSRTQKSPCQRKPAWVAQQSPLHRLLLGKIEAPDRPHISGCEPSAVRSNAHGHGHVYKTRWTSPDSRPCQAAKTPCFSGLTMEISRGFVVLQKDDKIGKFSFSRREGAIAREGRGIAARRCRGDAEVKQAFFGRPTNACLSSFVFAGVFFQNREGRIGKSAWPWQSGARQSRAHPLDQRKMPSRSTSPERAAAGVILAFALEPVT